jgi:tRNA A58 N-methylase Trm61
MSDVSIFWGGQHREDHLPATLYRIEQKEDQIMSALTDLQAADTALKDEVATFLTDIAGRLGTVDDASAEAVVADIQAEVAALKAADTTTPPPPPGG